VVTWRDILAWSGQMAVVLEPWETRALVELGQRRAVVISEALEKKAKGG
jgi:hypothetical protein